MLMTLCVATSCKKNDEPSGIVGFNSFKFLMQNNSGLASDVDATISEDEIIVEVPAAIDVTKLIPVYELSNPLTVVYVNKEPQQSGVSMVNFKETVDYRLRIRGRDKIYKVKVQQPVSFKKFRFLKAENTAGKLFKDYSAKIEGLNIEVTVPQSVDITKLAANFETTNGAVVKVNDVVQQSGVTLQNYSAPVTFMVTDADEPTPSVYVVKVIQQSAPEWQLALPATAFTYGLSAASIKMAVNPVDDMPYISYVLTKDATGVSYASENKRIGAVKYTGTGWSFIGNATGFSEAEGRDPVPAFDKNGSLYVAYKDYSGVSADQIRATVKKYENDVWGQLGAQQFTPTKADYLSIGVDGKEGTDGNEIVWLSLGKQDKTADATGYEQRQLYFMKFENGTWGQVPTASKMLVTSTKLVRADDKLYVGLGDRTTGASKMSVLGLANNQWSAMGPMAFLADEKTSGLLMSVAAGADGSQYLVYQNVSVSSAKIFYVMKYNGTAWEKIGDVINSGTVSEKYAVAVHPDGTLYFVYVLPGGLNVRTFNKQKNNWENPILIKSAADTEINGIDMQITKEGVIYVAIASNGTSKMELYKYDVLK